MNTKQQREVSIAKTTQIHFKKFRLSTNNNKMKLKDIAIMKLLVKCNLSCPLQITLLRKKQ